MKGKNIIFGTAKDVANKMAKIADKHGPTVLIFAGAVGVVAGVIMAAKAGKSSEEKTEKEHKELEEVHAMKEKASDEPIKENLENGESLEYTYTKLDYAKDLTHAYANLILAYAKVYGPAALTTLFSLLLIFASHKMMRNKYAAAYAGFVTMSNAYDQYRKNVVEDQGEEADERYRFGIKAIDEEKPLFDKDGNPKLDKNGNPKTVKNRKYISDKTMFDFRSILWDQNTSMFYDDSTCINEYEEAVRLEHNLAIIRNAQETANNRMHAEAMNPRSDGIGWISWDDVAKLLGITLTKKQRMIARDIIWRYDPRLDPDSDFYDPAFKAPDGWGDNKVNFGLYDPAVPGYEDRQRFISGHEDGVLLYMNYDGLTYNLW